MRNLYLKLKRALFLFSMGSTVLLAQNQKQVAEIKQETKINQLNKLESKLSMYNKQEKLRAEQIAKQKGWEISGQNKDGTYFELMRVAVDGSPIYFITYNKDAARSTRANTLNAGGVLGLNLNGEGMYVHVWDGGHARATHQEYDGSGGNRVYIGDGSNGLNAHSGHVMGTILASGYQAQAKGMAPSAQGYTFDWTSDSSEASNAASNGMILSNHSYGYGSAQVPDQYFGAYINESRTWDNIMYNAPYYLMVVAAGNDGGNDNYNAQPLDGYSAFDKLTGHSVSKNNLVVANLQDAQIDGQGNLISVTRNYSSSEGPTDDYRIKPDISGNGTDVYSSTTASNYAYSTMTGTSMAAPNVTGTLLLLQQHYSNLNGNVMRAASLKGLALHTADDVAPNGPDAETGWGLLNAKAAAQVISQDGSQSLIKELTLNQGQSYTTTVQATAGEKLMVSISWTDPAGTSTNATNSNTPVLVNDLDLVVQKSNTTYRPWRLTGVTTNGKGDNDVDPFERVDISNANGAYTITVSHEGSLSNGAQNFSLIVSGGSEGSSSDTQAPSTPTSLSGSNATQSSVQLSWNQSTDNVGVAGYEIFRNNVLYETISTNSALVDGLTADTTYNFKVRAFDAAGNKSNFSNTITITTASGGNGDDYCPSTANSTNDEYIQRVAVGTINNPSGAGNGYSDFTNISTDLGKNSSYTVTVTPNWTGTKYNEGYGIWIDFNNNGSFESSERVLSKSPTQAASVSETFVVPSNAVIGSTRMRVVMKYNATPTACETTFDYGEVEDYTINIVGSGGDVISPSQPSNLIATNISSSSVNLDWSSSTDNVGVDYYNVYQDGSLVKTATVSETVITGLSAGTTYSFRVSAVDASDNESVKSNAVTITTEDDVVSPVDYCNLSGNNSNYEWINYVSIGGMNNYTSSDNGYGDYTNKVANIGYGNNVIFVSAGYSGTTYTENWYVWIDLNHDGVFSSTELLLNGTTRTTNVTDGMITIPNSALTGETRMRVAMKYNTSSNACGTFAYGEVEDYTVNISNSATYSVNSEAVASTPMEEAIAHEHKGMTVYPNPVKNGLVNIVSDEITEGTYEIIDMSGKLLKSGSFSRGGVQINVEGISAGKYFVRISKDGRKAVKGLLIQ
ncbi:S8 family serine peptidase [Flavobacteriaceae bacterium Ap0902]|nr:S8 family serine peptidase [Flavobacteriaceae bacterium Ap0902]